ncbi:MAG: hypothetical protein V1754_07685 [Pseudomonadota bacterium]
MRLTTSFCVLLVVCLSFQQVDAKKRRVKEKPKVSAAVEETKVAITKLMGAYKWGMSPKEVREGLLEEARSIYKPKIKKTKEPLAQDGLRRELMEKEKEIEKSFVEFEGKRTAWDVSLVENEFAHKNSESMIYTWGNEDRRFYFFHRDRLWKIYIAFNSHLFKGKTFDDFSAVMQTRFGPPEKVGKKGVEEKKGELTWPQAGDTVLKAIDNTGFYGNFCLVLWDNDEEGRIREARSLNVQKTEADPLIEAVTGEEKDTRDVNEDVVDKITGKGTRAPSRSDSDTPGSSTAGKGDSDDSSPQKKKPAKKINPKDPLSGMDL